MRDDIGQTNSFVRMVLLLRPKLELTHPKFIVIIIFIYCKYPDFWKEDFWDFDEDKDK